MKPWLKTLLQVVGAIIAMLTAGAGGAAYMASEAAPNFALQQPAAPPALPVVKVRYYLLQLEYVLPKPTSYPGPVPTQLATAKVKAYTQPGYWQVLKIGNILKPDAATEVRVLGVLELQSPDAWPGHWIDLTTAPDSDDDI